MSRLSLPLSAFVSVFIAGTVPVLSQTVGAIQSSSNSVVNSSMDSSMDSSMKSSMTSSLNASMNSAVKSGLARSKDGSTLPSIPYEKYKLKNGLEVILAEDHKLSLVSCWTGQ